LRRRRPIPHRALGLALVVLACSAVTAVAETVEIVTPRHQATVLGTTTIEIRFRVPEGRRLERLEIVVDGTTLSTLTAPPWRATWDAGDGSTGHRIEARLVLDGGDVIRTSSFTSPLQIQARIAVDLVNVFPVVHDPSGNYVSGLTARDFVVLEDGAERPIERFTAEQRPLRIAVVLDTSQSMEGDPIDSARKAALALLDVLQPGDDGLVVSFADRVQVLQDVTGDRAQLAAAIQSVNATGGTALYDAVWRAAKRLETFDGRRVLVLLSDGRDEASNGFGPGSLHTLDEARTQALRSEAMVFAIGLGKNLDGQYAREWTRPLASDPGATRVTLKALLASLAETTGGRLFVSPGPGALRRAFEQVADDLRNQYSLAYAPPREAGDGKFHTIEVRVPRRKVQVAARRGYFAARPGEESPPPAR